MMPLDTQVHFHPVVLLPTFNNAGTLDDVLCRVLALGLPAMVINDGSTDRTGDVLERCKDRVVILNHQVNRGKAAALRTGFAAAHERGFTHAATIDTDGQLDPADLPELLNRARESPLALVLGSRAWRIEGYPAKNAVGRRLSNAAIRLQCGAKLSDSQCGLRVYPLGLMNAVRVGSTRFSFEAEAITRAVWAGCSVIEVPVHCTYSPPGGRVTHFSPGRDTPRGVLTQLKLLMRSLLPWPHQKWPGAGHSRATHQAVPAPTRDP